MKEFPRIIHRVSQPSHLDEAPQGTLCLVENGNYYIQCSKDETCPDWQPIAYEKAQDLLRLS